MNIQYIPCNMLCAYGTCFNTLRVRQNGHHFADAIFKCIFLNENVWILIGISLKFVPRGPINNIPALVQIMAWRWSGDNPLSEPMMSILLMHICVTRPQWAILYLDGVLVAVHVISPISFRVASLALGQSYDCPSASEATLKDMDELITWNLDNW